ncbi:MAG: MG2 domain-containing protein, partial [Singulisphaera sp.]
RLDPEEYFRKKHSLKNVETLDVGLVAADAEWTADVPGFGKYKPIDASYDLKVDVPGVWVVKVSDEKHLQATTLVLGSDLDAIVKASRDQILVFAQDMKTGKGRAGARVLVADGSGVVLEGEVGPDGVLLTGWNSPRDLGAAFDYLILDGPDVAGSGLGLPHQVAQGLTPRAYLYTDRPAYRPGQDVEPRGVVREVKDGQYAHQPGAEYRLDVTDSRGRQIVARSVTPRRSAPSISVCRWARPPPRARIRSGSINLARAPFPAGSGSRRINWRRSTSALICLERSITAARRSRPTWSPATSTAHRRPDSRSTSSCPTAAPCMARPTRRAGLRSSCRPTGSPRSNRSTSQRSCRVTTSRPPPTSRSRCEPSGSI